MFGIRDEVGPIDAVGREVTVGGADGVAVVDGIWDNDGDSLNCCLEKVKLKEE